MLCDQIKMGISVQYGRFCPEGTGADVNIGVGHGDSFAAQAGSKEPAADQKPFPIVGIGLAIVQKAAQKLGGAIRVESVLGKGSTFYVNLPNSILENG